MKLLLKFALFLFLSGYSYHCLSQTVVSQVFLRKEQGLSDRAGNLVTRDSFGFFYVSTDVDVMRYDGKEFLSMNTSVLFKYNVDVSGLKALTICPNSKILLRCEPIKALLYIDPGSLAVNAIEVELPMEFLVSGNEIFGINNKNGAYDIYSVNWDNLLKCKKLFSIKEKPENICHYKNDYFIETEKGVYHKERQNLSLLPNSIGSILCNKGSIILATTKAISIYENGAFKSIFNIKIENSECRILKNDKLGNVIAGYGNVPRFIDSFYIVDKSHQVSTFKALVKDIRISKDIYTDDVNFMWMTAGHHGMMALGLLRDGAKFYNKRDILKDQTFGSVVTGVADDGQGNILYTMEAKDLIYMNTKTGKSKILFPEINDGNGFIYNGKIYFDKARNCYFEFGYSEGTESYLFQIDPKKETFEKHTLNFQINDFIIKKNGKILLCGEQLETRSGILIEYDIKTKSTKTIFTDPSKINTIYYDEVLQNYWVGATDGLYIMDNNYKQLAKMDALQSNKNRFLRYMQINIINRYNDKILVGTLGGGLYVVDPTRFIIEKHIMNADGLSDNKVVGIIKDKEGNCWLPTFNGITIIDNNYKIKSVLYEQDGLPHKELNTKAYTQDHNGTLYLGTLNGLLVMDPYKVLRWKKSHGFYVNQIQVKYPNKTEIIKDLELSSNFIEMNINYLKPDYIYNLFDNFSPHITYDKKLLITQRPNSINVKKADAGTYVLNINFPNINGTDVIKFNINKDFTRLLISGAGAFIFLLLYQIIRLRKKNIIQKENAIKSKISILELEALQSQMNPHFLFNALGSIQYFIQTENIDKADDYLSDFALLMRMILESSHHKFISITQELKLLKLYMGLEQIRFNNKFDFKITLDNSVDPEYKIPPMLTQPFIENAINHGLNNLTQRKGQLEVIIDMKSPGVLSFIIKDNGIGRKKSAGRISGHKSRGTQIVRERVETLNSTNYFHVNIDTHDLIPGDESSGTQINILFHDMNVRT